MIFIFSRFVMTCCAFFIKTLSLNSERKTNELITSFDLNLLQMSFHFLSSNAASHFTLSPVLLLAARTTDTRRLNPFFRAQIQIPVPNQFLECEYKGLVFFRNNGWIMGKHGQGTHCTKMGAGSSAENAPEFICPICLPKPKSSGFQRLDVRSL